MAATMRTALTVAGSDSGGGAGIQADLKSFAAVGVHGCSVITCVTAQHTRGVTSIFPLPTKEIRAQLDAVLSDIPIHAVKTGMLYSRQIVGAVAEGLPRRPLVVDPVMVATVGASLAGQDLRDALVEHLIPRATLVTPNLHEASRLAGSEVDSPEAMRKAAKAIASLGAKAVLVKGGHLNGDEVVDVLFDGRFHEFRSARFHEDLHGSGCALASSITAYLALGSPLRTAVAEARQRIEAGFLLSYRVGRGVGVINSHWTPDRYATWRSVTSAAAELATVLSLAWVPEVGVNIAFALPGARTPEEVCALEGRIQRVGTKVAVTGPAEFGASKHVARIVLTAMRFAPSVRSAANLKYSEANSRRLRRSGFRLGTFDRRQQPEGTSTMEWGTSQAIRAAGGVPDVIHDLGSIGKEGMIRVLGRTPEDVLRKVRRIVRE